MSLVRRLLTQEKRALTESQLIRAALLGGRTTATGRVVSEQGAMGLITVFTCVRILSEAFAQVPLKVYRRQEDNARVEDRAHPLYRVLHERPNPEMTSFTFRETLMGHLATWGNAYAEVETNFFGEVIALWPLLPDRTKPIRKDGVLAYETRVPESAGNSTKDRVVTLPADRVLHIPGLGFDGLVGYSPIKMVREGIALAMAYEEFAGRFFGNDATPGFMLTTDKVIPAEKAADLERRWIEGHQGLTNAQRLAILDNGLKPERIGLPLEEAQFIEGRKMSRDEIVGLYRIPPHMVGDTEKSTSWGTGIAAQATGFIKFTMDPWFVRAEQAINTKLLGKNAQGPLFAEFDREGFLRGDFKERLSGYKELFGMGVLSNVGIARLENLPKPPKEVWLVPSNMVPADKIEDIAEQQAKPDPLGTPGQQDVLDKPKEAAMRRQIVNAQRHVFADVIDRILRRERADVPRGVERLLKQGASAEDLAAWLSDFYKEHRSYASKHMSPALRSFADLIASDVERETGRPAAVPPAFVKQYAEGFAERLCSTSHDELRAAILGKPEMERVLAAWDRRAERMAESEVLRAGNAFARKCYDEAGVRSVWQGQDCDDCRSLTSAAPGETFGKVHHPPLHDGCDCLVGVEEARAAAPVQRADMVALALASMSQAQTFVAAALQMRDDRPLQVNVAPAQVRVEPQVIPAPVVNVQPPQVDVHIDAPVLRMEPTFNLEATLKQPASELVRDAQGNIVGVRSVED